MNKLLYSTDKPVRLSRPRIGDKMQIRKVFMPSEFPLDVWEKVRADIERLKN